MFAGNHDRPRLRIQRHRLSKACRNVWIGRSRTSIRLEALEWDALEWLCRRQGQTVDDFCAAVELDPSRHERTRTARIRMALLRYFIGAATYSLRPAAYGNAIRTSSGRVASDITVDSTTIAATSSGARP